MKLDKYQEQMLRTWWSKDDSRYSQLDHPVIGLAVEAGELIIPMFKFLLSTLKLLKTYHKDKFKPNWKMTTEQFDNELIDCYYFLTALLWLRGLTYDDAAAMSWAKLGGGKHGWPENNKPGNDRLYICNRADDCGVEFCEHKVGHNSLIDCYLDYCTKSGLRKTKCFQCSE